MTRNSLDVANGVTLLNLCRNCGDKFKPTYSMINELLCDSCLGKGKTIQDQYWTVKYTSKIKLTENDFVFIGTNYNYFMIPRLAYPKDTLTKLKQQILDNQEMVEELEAIWDSRAGNMVTDAVTRVMEKYLGKTHP